MSKQLAQWAKQNKSSKGRPSLALDERRAMLHLRQEAKAAGATLHSNGVGGLAPSLILGIARRDEFKCRMCESRQDLDFHHKAGIVNSPRMDRMGHKNVPSAIVLICNSCHDKLHNEAREEGNDSSQVTPIGDYGTKKDGGDRGKQGLPWRQ